MHISRKMSVIGFGISLIFWATGCSTKNQSATMMDSYDPRNNIPLLQAATRTSGVNVIPAENRASAQKETESAGLTFAVTSNSSSSAQKLREIKALRDEGVLTQKEYETKKAEILKAM